MTRIVFWNLRHLGDGTDANRKQAIETVFRRLGADYVLFAELTTTSLFPPAQNLTYRHQNSAQLCYGCLDSNGMNVDLQVYTPQATPDYTQAGFKGGNDFTKLADRAVGYLGVIGSGVHVYVIHAPSGSSAGEKAISFLISDLNEHHGTTPWLLIGDFNVEPSKLETSPVGIVLGDLIVSPGEPTYIGPKTDKIFDYVACNFTNQVRISRIRCSSRFHGSDHYPIVVEFNASSSSSSSSSSS